MKYRNASSLGCSLLVKDKYLDYFVLTASLCLGSMFGKRFSPKPHTFHYKNCY